MNTLEHDLREYEEKCRNEDAKQQLFERMADDEDIQSDFLDSLGIDQLWDFIYNFVDNANDTALRFFDDEFIAYVEEKVEDEIQRIEKYGD